MRRTRFLYMFLTLVLSTLLFGTGCSSSKLATGALDPQKPGGVPFSLTRPAFKITENRPTAERPYSVFTLGVDYFPDPKQRFIVAIDPALLTEADFKLLFSEIGQLTEMNAETRDQIVPTITAIGTFVTNALGALAAAGALDQPSKDPEFFNLIQTYLDAGCPAEDGGCNAPNNCPALKTAWEVMKKRDGPPHAFNETEQEILTLGFNLIECRKKTFEVALKAAKAEVETQRSNLLPDAIARAETAIEQIQKAKTVDDLTAPRTTIGTLSDPLKTKLGVLARAAQNYVGLSEEKAELEGALDKDQWRLRHAMYLEAEIAKLERAAIVNNETQESAAILKLRELWARTIGVLEEYRRAEILRKTLRAVATTEQNRERPIRESSPMADYKLSQSELTELETAIATKRKALTPKETSSTPTPPPTRDVYPAVLWKGDETASVGAWVKDCLDDKNPTGCVEAPWNNKPKKGARPEFVIVVEKGVQP